MECGHSWESHKLQDVNTFFLHIYFTFTLLHIHTVLSIMDWNTQPRVVVCSDNSQRRHHRVSASLPSTPIPFSSLFTLLNLTKLLVVQLHVPYCNDRSTIRRVVSYHAGENAFSRPAEAPSSTTVSASILLHHQTQQYLFPFSILSSSISNPLILHIKLLISLRLICCRLFTQTLQLPSFDDKNPEPFSSIVSPSLTDHNLQIFSNSVTSHVALMRTRDDLDGRDSRTSDRRDWAIHSSIFVYCAKPSSSANTLEQLHNFQHRISYLSVV